MKTALTFLALIIGFIAYNACTFDNTYQIEGYEHGSMLCIDGGWFSNDTYMLVMEQGHAKDPEVQLLIEHGVEYCNRRNQ